MTLFFTDGCDSYNTSADILTKWQGANGGWTYSSTAGITGGGGIQATSAVSLRNVNGAPAGKRMNFGFYMKLSAAPGATAQILTVQNTAAALRGDISVSTSGVLILRDPFTTIKQTGGTLVSDNNWHWVDCYLDQTTSANQGCLVDGITQWNSSNNLGGNDNIGYYALIGVASRTLTIDDFIAYENTTGAPNDASWPLNARVITTLRPTADSVVQFTPSTGVSNYALVNEQAADDDTSYVQDYVSGHQDLYDFADLSFTPSAINAVMLNGKIRNANPGTANYQLICKNTSQADGTSTVLPTGYAVKQQYFYVDPATSAAWAAAGLNTAKFGIKRV